MLIGIGIGAQGVIGWYMVKSGLEQEIIDTKGVPRVSQYRLAAHLTAALLLYIGMLHTALGLRRDIKLSGGNDALWSAPAVRRYRGLVGLAGGMVLFTAVSGAFVAGLDAGLVYNEFPTMGGRLVPSTEELLDIRYAKRPDGGDRWWRNMLENPVTAQFDHRLFVSGPVEPADVICRRRRHSPSYLLFPLSLAFPHFGLLYQAPPRDWRISLQPPR